MGLWLFASLLLGVAWAHFGCGAPVGDYEERVLEKWPELERFSHRLVERAGRIYELKDLDAYKDLLSEAVAEVDSLARYMRSLHVPGDYRKTHNMMLRFLNAFSSYLVGLSAGMDVVLYDQTDEDLDIESVKEEARQLLQDYQDGQEYNGASLDLETWNLPQILADAVNAIYGGEKKFPVNKINYMILPEEVVAYWYDYLNKGNVEAMYGLLSPYSSLPEELGYEGMVEAVNRAREGGLEVAYSILGTERIQENEMEKAVVRVRAEYGERLDAETGEIIPPAAEEVRFYLDLVDNIWYVSSLDSSSGIW